MWSFPSLFSKKGESLGDGMDMVMREKRCQGCSFVLAKMWHEPICEFHFFFWGAEDWTWGPTHAKYMLYHGATSQPLICILRQQLWSSSRCSDLGWPIKMIINRPMAVPVSFWNFPLLLLYFCCPKSQAMFWSVWFTLSILFDLCQYKVVF